MNRTKNGTLLDDRDWSRLTRGEQIRSLELDGYLVLPDLLSPEHIARLKAEISGSRGLVHPPDTSNAIVEEPQSRAV